MKKTFIAIILTIICLNVHAQMETWYSVDLGRLAYRANTINTNIRQFSESGPYAPGDTIKVPSWDLSFDIYTKHTYFFLDASVLPNLILGPSEEKLKNYDIGEMLPIRLAFGFPITKYFNFYAGGQWQYAWIEVFESGNAPFPYMVGGNQRGAGAHLVFGLSKINIRYSYMYDWIRRNKRDVKGIAKTHEISIAIAPFNTSSFGFIVRGGLRDREMEGGYMAPNQTLNSKAKQRPFIIPTMRSSEHYLSVGIFIEGLFSGTTRTISETTQKLYTE